MAVVVDVAVAAAAVVGVDVDVAVVSRRNEDAAAVPYSKWWGTSWRSTTPRSDTRRLGRRYPHRGGSFGGSGRENGDDTRDPGSY